MARNFKELQAKMTPEQKVRANAQYKKLLTEMPLAQLREARELTQVRLAEILGVNQPAVSKLERSADMYVSTLRSYVQAMGGELRIEAVFSDGRVAVSQFKDLKPAPVEEIAEKKTATRPPIKTRGRTALEAAR